MGNSCSWFIVGLDNDDIEVFHYLKPTFSSKDHKKPVKKTRLSKKTRLLLTIIIPLYNLCLFQMKTTQETNPQSAQVYISI